MAVITEEVGDIFDSPPNSILIHACNAKGVWGSGVALAFKKRFPKAYKQYRSHCLTKGKPPITGTTLLIPPQNFRVLSQNTDVGCGSSPSHQDDRYVACLFTSHGYGKTVDPPETILRNTRAALEDLAMQIAELKANPGIELGECRAVRINSGRFGVPWAQTKRILEEGSLDIVVVRPDAEEVGKRTRKGMKKDGKLEETENRSDEGKNEDSEGGIPVKRSRISERGAGKGKRGGKKASGQKQPWGNNSKQLAISNGK